MSEITLRDFTALDFPQLLDEETGKFVSLPSSFWIRGFSQPTNEVPPRTDNYCFRKGLFRDIVNFLRRPYNRGLWITGPTGSGKTSVITELAAILNWPVQSVTCTGTTEFDDLCGQIRLVKKAGSESAVTDFVYGPLATAMKYGHLLILNEVDMLAPEQIAGFHDLLEGRPLILTLNGGEVVRPHPMFRVVATANSRGNGDETGSYQGINTLNIASLDRFRFLEVDYLPPKVEEKVLEKAILPAKLDSTIIKGMVKVAEKIRSAFESGNLSATMSTRSLVFWANLMSDYLGCNNAVKYTLKLGFAERLSKTEQAAVYTVAQEVFGGDLASWLD